MSGRPGLRICHLYPDLLNLYGDRGNIMVLVQRARWRDLGVTVTEVGLGESVDPAAADLFFIGGGEDRQQRIASDDLCRVKRAALEDAVQDGAVMLAVCGGYQLVGRYYRPAEGEELLGVGLLDLWTEHPGPSARRLIGNLVVAVDGMDEPLIGFENHGGRTHLGPNARPLGRVLTGFGNNGEDGWEGAVARRVYGTYLHGPLLPKNPAFADRLIHEALERRHPGVAFPPLPDVEAARARAVMLARLGQRPGGRTPRSGRLTPWNNLSGNTKASSTRERASPWTGWSGSPPFRGILLLRGSSRGHRGGSAPAEPPVGGSVLKGIWSRHVCAGLVLALALGTCVPASAGAGDADRLLHVGIDAYRTGAPARALQSFAEAAARAPRDALPALWAGVAAAAVGRWQDSRAYLHEALRRPHTPDVARLAEAWLARLEAFDTSVPGAVDPAAGISALAYASNPRLTWSQARWLGQAVQAAAGREGLDPWLLASVIYIESRFNHQSVSWAGAMGLGQLMPGTAHAAGVDPKDPWQNVLGAAEILRWHYLEFKDWTLALAAYNAGGEAVRRYRGVPPYAETQWYVRAVLWVYGQLRRPA